MVNTEYYLDAMPIADWKYLVVVEDKSDNTLSVVGTDDEHSLDYRGLDNINKLFVGTTHDTYDDEGNLVRFVRLR